ncbi:MAG: hypothetical protein ACREFE_14855 [Limisphaerales bacterium]
MGKCVRRSKMRRAMKCVDQFGIKAGVLSDADAPARMVQSIVKLFFPDG